MAAIDAQGTTITVEDGAVGTATIGGLDSFEFAGYVTTVKDRTTLASTAKVKAAALIDYGQFTMDFKLRDINDAGQLELIEMQAAAATRQFVVTLPEGTNNVLTFDGFVTSLSLSGAVEGDIVGSCTVEITGPVVES